MQACLDAQCFEPCPRALHLEAMLELLASGGSGNRGMELRRVGSSMATWATQTTTVVMKLL